MFALAQSTMSAGVPWDQVLPVSRGWLSEDILAARLGENFPLDITFHRTRAFDPLMAFAVASGVIAVWTLLNAPVFYKQRTNFIESE
jgi:hypothetical protein